MGRRTIIGNILLSCLLLLAGCGGKLPEMTQEQETQIVEYAAAVVMQHLKDDDSRLVDLSLYEETKEALPEEPGPEPETEMPDDTAGTETEEATETVSEYGSLDELLVPEGISVTYAGYRLADTYPDEENANPYFALDASEGKKLLVLEFVLKNTTEAEMEVDIFSLSPTCIVMLNGTENTYALSTMLLDDLSTFIGSVDKGEEKKLVLLAEVEAGQSESIVSLQLMVITEEGSVTTLLQ